MSAAGEPAPEAWSYDLRPPDPALAEPVSPSRTHFAGVRRQAALVAGFGLALPLAAGALGLGLLNGSRRRGVNFFTSTWPRALLATNGIRINVVGAQNLTARRPGVFLYNHRNRVDPFIAAALMRDDWIKIAKKELARDPIIGTLLKLNDGVFLDRDDTAAAVETLHHVEERAKEGLSILIAPEGTSLDTTGVGPFKKGAFRIAMAAGVPIVPIVIRNAEIIASRDSMEIHPGTVDVAVLPPISVDDWTLDTLVDRIAAVRQRYLDTLADWPVWP
ncbi:MAG: 1-acyl-sn-glycerol-3-phosphate acyltransferase [Mycobacterium sp.]|nr:MAG: 1-acyl-sn-glycerol-3-phosphate acyltransferase [Mycobacterium sp.]